MKILTCFGYLSTLGFICLIPGIIGYVYYKYRENTQTRRTEAEFVAYNKTRRKKGKYSYETVYQLVLRFRADLQEVRGTTSYYHKKQVLKPGDKVTIYYNPNRPEKFRVEGDDEEGCVLLIRLGAAIIGLAAVISLLAEVFVFRELIRF